MNSKVFSLHEVLAVARIHPFYSAQIQYPPDSKAIQNALDAAASDQAAPDFRLFPLTTKKQLYKAIERLTADTSPENTYRHSSYLSITGGGSGGLPMLFATDAFENRVQRARMGEFIRTCGLVGPGDWVLTTHTSGHFYRSLDLTLEILENAGASVLSAGNVMELAEVTAALAHYRGNVLSGDGSQVIRAIHHIATLPAEERKLIKIDKIIYTSEPLTPAQRAYVTHVLGPVKIYSLLGSSEAGPWALSCPDLTGDGPPEVPGAADFVFDTRTMRIEILDPSALDGGDDSAGEGGESLPDGSPGIIVQTSLQRLKNPLVRYVSGDIGSLHPLPELATTSGVIPLSELEHFRVLRLRGRDGRFSFKWYGMYFEFDKLAAFMQAEERGILQWQVVLASSESSPELTLEVRVLVPSSNVGDAVAAKSELVKAIEDYFVVFPENTHLFLIKFVKDLTEFERSSTGGKVLHFIDRAH
ncbi:uncharacterized protein B0H64DRAFT_366614 [Chaetomium fimeti]|uniref:AMP-dependent synthetase/ligase domain-containing protein n=1 Tax=Chaetomium fimeti TaxID=1854472 RepID=A0AAE0H7H6_9PEZI|nr:hypothetical protein B0H64DRAFT_366614 [Chaetomium fimeti]